MSISYRPAKMASHKLQVFFLQFSIVQSACKTPFSSLALGPPRPSAVAAQSHHNPNRAAEEIERYVVVVKRAILRGGREGGDHPISDEKAGLARQWCRQARQ